MTTIAAMERALTSKDVKNKYNPNTLRTIAKRFADGKLSRDKQVEFLTANGFFIRNEIMWGIVKKGKKEAPVVQEEQNLSTENSE